MPAVSLPVALARSVDTMVATRVGELVWEPNGTATGLWLVAGGSPPATAQILESDFPDLVPVLAAALPESEVLEGELVVWDTGTGRLDFEALQARMTAGRRIDAVAAARPAHFVAFDILAKGRTDLRGDPLRARRPALERVVAGLPLPIVLSQQTTLPTAIAITASRLPEASVQRPQDTPGSSRARRELIRWQQSSQRPTTHPARACAVPARAI